MTTPPISSRFVRRATTFVASLTLTLPLVAQQPAVDPPARAGRLSTISGAVALLPAGDSIWARSTHNFTVSDGDRLQVARDGLAELDIGSFTARLARSTDVDVTSLTDDIARLGVSRGTVRLSVFRMLPNEVIEVSTPGGPLRVRTVGQYRVTVADDGATRVVVDNGTAVLAADDEVLRSGQAAEISPNGATRRIQRPGLDEFDRWSASRDTRLIRSDCGIYMSSDIPGCADLSDHGDWYADATYGTVWYPRYIDASWEPYRRGHWEQSRCWGMVWVDDAPWGFAPFHYGRWVHVSSRWAWVPGPIVVRPYYAPALVAWVGGPNWGIGISTGVRYWVPLGPRDYFAPTYHHTTYYVTQINITNVRGYSDDRRSDARPPYTPKDGAPPRYAVPRNSSTTTATQRGAYGTATPQNSAVESRSRAVEQSPEPRTSTPVVTSRSASPSPAGRTASPVTQPSSRTASPVAQPATSNPVQRTATPRPTTSDQRSAPPPQASRSAPPPQTSQSAPPPITARRRPPGSG